MLIIQYLLNTVCITTILIKVNMLIKRVDNFTFDCFEGNGWDNWTRMQLQEDGLWYVVGGSHEWASKAAFILNKKFGV